MIYTVPDGYKWELVYVRQMPNDVPLVVEKGLILGDYWLRRVARRFLDISCVGLLALVILTLQRFLNGSPPVDPRPVMPLVIVPGLAVSLLVDAFWIRGPLNHAVKMVGRTEAH